MINTKVSQTFENVLSNISPFREEHFSESCRKTKARGLNFQSQT